MTTALVPGCSRDTHKKETKATVVKADVPQARDEDPGVAEVRALERLGGHVVRDADDPTRPIVELNLNGAAVADTELKEMAAMKGLQNLHTVYLVNHPGVTDTGLKELAGWTALKKLNLEGTTVTDAGLKTLRGLKELAELNLIGTQVTDEGLKELADLKKLQQLKLFGTKVSDSGVAALQKALPDCKISHRLP
jgi:hypothetical protein